MKHQHEEHSHENHGHAHNHQHEEDEHEMCSCGHDHSGEHHQGHVEAVAAVHLHQLDHSHTKPAGEALVFRIAGLDCPDCAAKLAQLVSKLPGVVGAEISYATSRLQVAVAGPVNIQQIEQCIVQMGYSSQILAGYQAEAVADTAGVAAATPEPTGLSTFWLKNKRAITTILSGLFLAAGWGAELVLHQTVASKALFLLGMLVGGFYVAKSGLYAILNRTLDMNFLMSLATVGAVAIGEWNEGAMVVFLFSLGNTLQAYTMDKTRQSIRSLINLAPKEALVQRGGLEMTLPTQAILLGDTIIVRPGERIAMDGIVTDGNSAVNQAPITGESMPVDKVEGERVFAGTINGNGSLEVQVDRLVEDNTLSRIMHLVEVAQSERAPAQMMVDRFAAYYTPAVIALAVGLAILPPLFGGDFISWFKRALILLIVSCPCALVISTPVAIVSAIGNASRQGVLIKGGAYLEAMARIRTVAFDKTGTLTAGKAVLSNLLALVGDQASVLRQAAALESRSEHPLAQAVVRAANEQGLLVPAVREFQALTGSGATGIVDGRSLGIGNDRLLAERKLEVSEQTSQQVALWYENGQTVVYLFDERQVLGLLAFADQVRPEAATAIQELRRAGIQSVAMLTGDHRRTAAAIGERLGVDTVKAELLPEDKVAAIGELLQTYKQVAMVGDGVNDAPALAASTVGIALGVVGTDAAIETADIALMADDLSKLAFLIRLSRRTLSIIGQNIVLSLLIKGVVLALTLMGRAELWMGVFADTGAALLVIANGMRLMRN